MIKRIKNVVFVAFCAGLFAVAMVVAFSSRKHGTSDRAYPKDIATVVFYDDGWVIAMYMDVDVVVETVRSRDGFDFSRYHVTGKGVDEWTAAASS